MCFELIQNSHRVLIFGQEKRQDKIKYLPHPFLRQELRYSEIALNSQAETE